MMNAFQSKSGKSASLLIFVLMLFVAGSLSAKVFRGAGRVVDILNNGSLPWETISRTPMMVNGRTAMMHLYSARYTEPVAEQLKARFEVLGAEVHLARSAEGVTGVARWLDGRKARFLVVAPHSSPRKHVVVYFTEADSAIEKVKFPVPSYKRARVLSTVVNGETESFLATLKTADSSTEIHTFYSQQMQADGWEMLVPAMVNQGILSGMAVYKKKKKICYVQAINQVGDLNMITLLVKTKAL